MDPEKYAYIICLGKQEQFRAGLEAVLEAGFALIQSGGMKKGDVRTAAQIAGVMGAKCTLDIIPMCKTVQKDMFITDIRLLSKTGGVHGDYKREE